MSHQDVVIKVSQDGTQFYCECGCSALIWQAPFRVKDFDRSGAAQARHLFVEWLRQEREVQAVEFV